MEDHLKNKNRLEKEWEALCTYQAEPNAATIAHKEENIQKNRLQDIVACMYSLIWPLSGLFSPVAYTAF